MGYVKRVEDKLLLAIYLILVACNFFSVMYSPTLPGRVESQQYIELTNPNTEKGGGTFRGKPCICNHVPGRTRYAKLLQGPSRL